MCQREGQIAAPEEEHSVQEHQLPGASNLQNSAPMAGMQVPQMSGGFKRALDIVVPATLVIKATATRAFDGEASSSYYATGFVVDAARGLILTNRHVVTPGPVTAEAIFLNREELLVRPLYYDPIHDFGFFRFDPRKVQFMPVTEVKLRPEAATVGLEVRVVGNDSGEKVSILAGTLARLDRDAPHYTKKGYNDFNTFYLQAASGTKGGSSGSPVVNCLGEVVALNAGGKTKAASAFYLPLERVVRALHLLQACHIIAEHPDAWRAPVIPRGDLQATFVFKGFNEVQRLGLTHATEAAVRAASCKSANSGESGGTTGMLVVDSVIPGGPADGLLEPGDVLVRILGEVIVHFLPMEALLDDHVGQHVSVEIERGGQLLVQHIQVQDLHAVSPRSFLEVAGGIVHGLSYQQARNNTSKVGQVYVADPGYMLARGDVPRSAIITQLAGERTPDVAAFMRQLACLKHGQRVPLQYYLFNERHRQKTAILHIDHRWYGEAQHWTRDDAHGTWNCDDSLPLIEAADINAEQQASHNDAMEETPAEADIDDEDTDGEGEGKVPALHSMESQAERVRRSLVMLDVKLPPIALPDGVHSQAFAGNGVIVHQSEKLGLVMTSRNTVPVSVGDIMLSFGAHPAEVEAKIRFLHPLHNFAILSYNPADLPMEARERVVPAVIDTSPMHDGDKVALIGLNTVTRAMARSSTVIDACFSLNIAPIAVPRYRAVNEEVVKLDLDFGDAFCGVLVDEQDHLRALWASYSEQVYGKDRKICAGLQAAVSASWVESIAAEVAAADDAGLSAADPPVNDEDREFCAGLQAAVFAPWVERIAAEAAAAGKVGDPAWEPPSVSLLDMELEPVLLSKAAQLGLPAQWVARLSHLDNQRRQVLRVRSCLAGSNARNVLKDGDFLLSVAGRAMSHFQALEAAVAGSRICKIAPIQTARSSMPGVASSSDLGETASEGTLFRTGLSQGCESLEKKRPGTVHTTDSSRSPTFKRARTTSSDLLDLLPLASDASTLDPRVLAGDLSGVAAGSADAATDVQLKICRDGKVQKVAINLAEDHGLGTRRLIHWCGAQFQAPHRAVKEAGALPDSCGVFISRWHHGSPAHRYALYALQFVQEVNGMPTPDLATFAQAISKLEDEAFVLIKLVSCNTLKSKVLSLKQDLKYWPTWELVLDTATSAWTRRNITAMQSKL